MKNKKIQLKICKAMLDANRSLTIGDVGTDAVAVTVDGYIAYSFLKSECIFDITKIPSIKNGFLDELFEIDEKDELLTVTPYKISYKGKIVQKLTCDNADIYLDEKLYKKIKKFKLYGYESDKRILALDNFDCPIAIVMPVRVCEDEI